MRGFHMVTPYWPLTYSSLKIVGTDRSRTPNLLSPNELQPLCYPTYHYVFFVYSIAQFLFKLKCFMWVEKERGWAFGSAPGYMLNPCK
jgi:uncharacterized phage infection (PIP) family protein YhgE